MRKTFGIRNLVRFFQNFIGYSLCLNEMLGPQGGGQDARSNFVPFMQYAGLDGN